MELTFYKSDHGNFGDDLNPWLWPKLIPDFYSMDNNINFIGIGSILLDQFFDKDKINLIFGSGSRDYLYKPNSKFKLDVRFVRGPLTAKSLNNEFKYITDSAYCIALEKNTISYLKNTKKKYEVSFIPYFRHIDLIDWKLFEQATGIHVIYPTYNVDFILSEVASSKRIMASAMHGAIIADILRIPWKRVFMGEVYGESLLTSEFKWTDWLESINIKEIKKLSIPIYIDYSKNKFNSNYQKISNLFKIIKFFKSNMNYGFSLSDDFIFNEILDKLNEELNIIQQSKKNFE